MVSIKTLTYEAKISESELNQSSKYESTPSSIMCCPNCSFFTFFIFIFAEKTQLVVQNASGLKRLG